MIRDHLVASIRSRQRRKRSSQIHQLGWFVQHPVDMLGNIMFGDQSLAPTGKQNDGCFRRCRFDGSRDLPAVDVRHSKVGDDDVEWLMIPLSGFKSADALLATR